MLSKVQNFSCSLYASELNWNIFLALAHFKNYSRTAEHFGVSQSSVSKAIAAMENFLGFKLVNRDRRPLTLTAEGLLLKEQLQEAGLKLESTLSKIKEGKNFPFSLRFGCVESVCRYVTPQIVIQLDKRLTKFSQISGNSQILLEKLISRDLDIALVASDFRDVSNLYRVEVFSEPSILILPNTVPDKDNWTWEDLKKITLPLIFSPETSAAGKLNQRFLSRMRMHFQNRCETDSDEAMMGLIERGYGWAISRPSTLLASHTSLKSVRVKKLPPPGFNRKLHIISLQNSFEEESAEIAQICKTVLETELKNQSTKLVPWL